MTKHQLFFTTAVMSLSFSPAFAQTTTTSPTTAPTVADKQCKNLTGAALDACLKAAPGRSGDAAAREGGRTPGSSENAASRTGAAPGQAATDATGGTAGTAATGKGKGTTKQY